MTTHIECIAMYIFSSYHISYFLDIYPIQLANVLVNYYTYLHLNLENKENARLHPHHRCLIIISFVRTNIEILNYEKSCVHDLPYKPFFVNMLQKIINWEKSWFTRFTLQTCVSSYP